MCCVTVCVECVLLKELCMIMWQDWCLACRRSPVRALWGRCHRPVDITRCRCPRRVLLLLLLISHRFTHSFITDRNTLLLLLWKTFLNHFIDFIKQTFFTINFMTFIIDNLLFSLDFYLLFILYIHCVWKKWEQNVFFVISPTKLAILMKFGT